MQGKYSICSYSVLFHVAGKTNIGRGIKIEDRFIDYPTTNSDLHRSSPCPVTHLLRSWSKISMKSCTFCWRSQIAHVIFPLINKTELSTIWQYKAKIYRHISSNSACIFESKKERGPETFESALEIYIIFFILHVNFSLMLKRHQLYLQE